MLTTNASTRPEGTADDLPLDGFYGLQLFRLKKILVLSDILKYTYETTKHKLNLL